jgi:hypothetical protein
MLYFWDDQLRRYIPRIHAPFCVATSSFRLAETVHAVFVFGFEDVSTAGYQSSKGCLFTAHFLAIHAPDLEIQEQV